MISQGLGHSPTDNTARATYRSRASVEHPEYNLIESQPEHLPAQSFLQAIAKSLLRRRQGTVLTVPLAGQAAVKEIKRVSCVVRKMNHACLPGLP